MISNQRTPPKAIIANVISANLAALAERLEQAAAIKQEARQAMKNRKQNLAIVTALALEKILPEAQALFNAAVELHRGARHAPAIAKGGAA